MYCMSVSNYALHVSACLSVVVTYACMYVRLYVRMCDLSIQVTYVFMYMCSIYGIGQETNHSH
jgi:hypothetical protein